VELLIGQGERRQGDHVTIDAKFFGRHAQSKADQLR
jgi:hypothetical protein